jgi:arabinogalactan endo-1,4-beta-galactosidase
MKKITLINSFCNCQDKLDLLKENVIKIEKLSVDVMVFTPITLPDDITNLCDYVIISKENPVFDWSEKSYYQWWGGTVNGYNIELTTTYPIKIEKND